MTAKRLERLVIKQLEDSLKEWTVAKQGPKPKKGWVNLI